jgi:hypothetical protein
LPEFEIDGDACEISTMNSNYFDEILLSHQLDDDEA